MTRRRFLLGILAAPAAPGAVASVRKAAAPTLPVTFENINPAAAKWARLVPWDGAVDPTFAEWKRVHGRAA